MKVTTSLLVAMLCVFIAGTVAGQQYQRLYTDDSGAEAMIEESETPTNPSNVEEKVQEMIKNEKVVIFSKTYCPYCRRTKKLFDQMGVKYSAWELDKDDEGALKQQFLAKMTGQRTVPNVFINGRHIGGADSVSKLYANGDLRKLLVGTLEQPEDAKAKIGRLIEETPVMVFSKSYCPYCKQAKSTLDQFNIKYTAMELDKEVGGNEYQEALRELSSQRTVPNVFIGGVHIGGSDKVKMYASDGEIQVMAKEAFEKHGDSEAANAVTIPDTPSPEEEVHSLIKTNPVMIFSKSHCPYCKRLKALFDSIHVQVKAHELDLDDGGPLKQHVLRVETGQTVPNCFIGGKHVGGFSEVSALKDSGELQKMLESAGVKVQE